MTDLSKNYVDGFRSGYWQDHGAYACDSFDFGNGWIDGTGCRFLGTNQDIEYLAFVFPRTWFY